jgi:metabolite-proton symporter
VDSVLEQDALTPEQRKGQIRKAVVASAVGTSIEWYDFFLYTVAAAIVFPTKFFPADMDPFVATMLSFTTAFFGFAARPLGAIIFGHFGDRIGRKASLISTLLLMGVATMGIGFVPDYETIGIWGAVLLTLGRVVQGIGVGGEWGGSVLLAGEWTDPKRRGFTTSWAQFGAPAGMLLANGALGLMSVTMSDAAFLEWGWRVPFLSSFVLIGIGFWIRLGILETPVFAKMKREGRVKKAPVLDVLKHNWREVILTALLRTGQQVPFYIFTVYVVTYASTRLGYGRDTILGFVMVQCLVSMVTIPFFGHLSDRIGRRRITTIGCAVMLVFPFVYFAMVDSGVIALMFLAIVLGLPLHDLQYGPQAAFISESFPGSNRYSGASLGYQLASLTAGGPAPQIALALQEGYGSSMAVAGYVSVCALVSLVCVALLKDRTGQLDHA